MSENVIHRLPRPQEVARMTTAELRDAFLLGGLYAPGRVEARFTDLDRLVAGGIVPAQGPLELPNHRETGRAFFLEQRELGAINTGGPGVVHVDSKTFAVEPHACVYAGVGSRKVVFESQDPANPAKFFFLSCPAHAAFPAAVLKSSEAGAVPLGTQAAANQRVIHKYIHPGGIRSCQLVMGFTALAEGSVWNTFPPHTHNRRTEIYFYFDLGERVLVHFLGEPSATRHLFIHNEQAALSPSWSIHAGCGAGNYKFIWGMAGENQAFDDMDAVKPADLR
jgi:4-deoxy-L-threo-5-hexosulose-uronate ketol-isomerase